MKGTSQPQSQPRSVKVECADSWTIGNKNGTALLTTRAAEEACTVLIIMGPWEEVKGDS